MYETVKQKKVLQMNQKIKLYLPYVVRTPVQVHCTVYIFLSAIF
jgi:hypothetical protein